MKCPVVKSIMSFEDVLKENGLLKEDNKVKSIIEKKGLEERIVCGKCGCSLCVIYEDYVECMACLKKYYFKKRSRNT